MAGWADPAHRLDMGRLRELFRALDWQVGLKLPAGAPKCELLVCGGAVMCYQIEDRGTGDVDVMFPPLPPEVREAAKQVAKRRGIPSTWINDGPANFAHYGAAVVSRTLYDGEHLRVVAPHNSYILGMKLHSARIVDTRDAVWLMSDTGIQTSRELHNAAEVVSVSIGQKWRPTRRQKRFIRGSVRTLRKERRAGNRPKS